MEYSFIEIMFLLVAWHCFADYALQNDFMANAKNRNTDIGKEMWLAVLPAHAMIHAAGVFVITQSVLLALVELVSHAAIDFLKCENKISFKVDQYSHIAIKLVILVMFVVGLK